MLNPRYMLARNNKGDTLLHQGKYDDAVKAFDEAIELNRDFAQAWNGKGNAFKALCRTTEANAAFAKAKELGYKS